MLFYSKLKSLCTKENYIKDIFGFYKEPLIIQLTKKDTTITYLLNSSLTIPSPFNNVINKPLFMIQRTVTNKIISDLRDFSPIHIIYGHRISGKTSCLIAIFEMIKDKTRYFFPSNTKISPSELEQLFQNNNSCFIFDSYCLEPDQIYMIAKMKNLFIEKLNYIVIVVNSSDSNSLDLMMENNNYRSSEVKNIFDSHELNDLNKKLQNINLPTFISKERKDLKNNKKPKLIVHTILDNLCMIAENFSEIDKSFVLPNLSDFTGEKELALLLLLATEETLSSYDLFYFDIKKEANKLVDAFPSHFEINYMNKSIFISDSHIKLSTNSRYYLLKYLSDYATSSGNFDNILSAYKYIYERVYNSEDEFNTPRKMLDYIKFDVLNDIFDRNGSHVIKLIKYIYEGLENEMNVNPQFKHQRAKSIFWLCSKIYDEMNEAAKYIDLARYDIENILKSKYNEKLKISLEHIKYTQASIWGRICFLEEYKNIHNVEKTVNYYYEALLSNENSGECESLKSKKADKHIFNDLLNIFRHVKRNKIDDSNLNKKVDYLINFLDFNSSI